MAKFCLLLSGDFGIIFLKEFIHNGSLRAKILTQPSHYKTIITQAAAKVKRSLLFIALLELSEIPDRIQILKLLVDKWLLTFFLIKTQISGFC